MENLPRNAGLGNNSGSRWLVMTMNKNKKKKNEKTGGENYRKYRSFPNGLERGVKDG